MRGVVTDMLWRTCKNYIGKAFTNLWRNKIISVVATVVISISLILLGFALILGFNISYASTQIEGQYEIHAYIDLQYTEQQAMALKNQIVSIQYVENAEFISKDDALVDMQSGMEDSASAFEMLKGEENPLPHTFDITLTDVKMADSVVAAVSAIEGVEEVKNRSDILDKIIATTRGLQIFAFAAMIAFAFMSIFIISYTIKMSVMARSNEIEIMKYVGATDWYIRWPFIIEGAVMGLVAAAITFIPVYIIYGKLNLWWSSNIPMVDLVSMADIRNVLILAFVLSGCILGAIGSIVSIRKHLRV